MMNRKGRKRLSVNIPEDLHEAIVLIALQRNVTITKYVIRAIVRYSLHEHRYDKEIIVPECDKS